ncbi:MAG TPA: class I SAM-dependent methyltransferase [Actinopolymorphaceae bacterium]
MSDAVAAPFSGWDFGYLRGKVRECEIPWSYEDLARAQISTTTRLLDLDTGGGETLAGVLEPFRSVGRGPAHVVATESWPPNVPVARERLEPLGIFVHESAPEQLPAEDAAFDVVLNRHGACNLAELKRVLAPGGVYLNQGVGKDNDIQLNEVLDGPPPPYAETLERTVTALEGLGFEIAMAEEAFVDYGFRDIGAVVFHLNAVSWQVPGFDVEKYDRRLRDLDARIRADGEFVVRHHRFVVKAIKP